MLKIALATLRTRWVSFAGAFIALTLGITVVAMMAQTLAATYGTPHPGPQRFAAAKVVVIPAGTVRLTDEGGDAFDQPIDNPPGLPADLVPGGIADRTFPARVAGGPKGEVGHAWSAAAFTPYTLTRGRAPRSDDEIVVADTRLLGRDVPVSTLDAIHAYRVVGIVGAKWFEDAVFFTDTEAARLSPKIDAYVTTTQPTLHGPYKVLTGDARHDADPDPSGGADALLNPQAMAGTSTGIIVSIVSFLVIGTFAFIVDQRRRELALLRTVGATPRQVRRMVLAEATVVGLIAGPVGLILGSLALRPLNGWMIGNGVSPAWFHVGVNVPALLVAFLLGLGGAVAGAAAVSFRAARVRPTEALREAAADRRVMGPVRWLLGLGLLAGGLGTAVFTYLEEPLYAGNLRKYQGVPVLLIGAFAVLAPIVVPGLARLATWPLRRTAGAMVVRESALTAGRRTAALVAPVIIAVGFMAAASAAQDTADAARTAQVREQTRADYIVTGQGVPELGPKMVAALRAAGSVNTFTPVQVSIADRSGAFLDVLTGQAVDSLDSVRPTVLEGSLTGLGDDFLVVGRKTARSDDLAVGEQLRAWLPDGEQVRLAVAAITADNLLDDGVYISSAHAGEEPPTRIDVQGSSLRALRAAGGPGVVVLPVAKFRAAVKADQQKQKRLASLTIAGIAVAYSLLAVANTLVMAAAGRRRELAVLKLAGATRRQVLGFVAAESVLVVAIGTLVGAAATAVILGAQWATLNRLAGAVPVTVPWTPIGAVALACLGIALAASVLPAWLGLRARVLEAAGPRE